MFSIIDRRLLKEEQNGTERQIFISWNWLYYNVFDYIYLFLFIRPSCDKDKKRNPNFPSMWNNKCVPVVNFYWSWDTQISPSSGLVIIQIDAYLFVWRHWLNIHSFE